MSIRMDMRFRIWEFALLKLVNELAKYDLYLEGMLWMRLEKVVPNQCRRRGCPSSICHSLPLPPICRSGCRSQNLRTQNKPFSLLIAKFETLHFCSLSKYLRQK